MEAARRPKTATAAEGHESRKEKKEKRRIRSINKLNRHSLYIYTHIYIYNGVQVCSVEGANSIYMDNRGRNAVPAFFL